MNEQDAVNHPPHYLQHPSGVECITITEHFTFCVGNAIRYLWRSDHKHGVEDLRKARWYVDREIARLAGKEGKEEPPDEVPSTPFERDVHVLGFGTFRVRIVHYDPILQLPVYAEVRFGEEEAHVGVSMLHDQPVYACDLCKREIGALCTHIRAVQAVNADLLGQAS